MAALRAATFSARTSREFATAEAASATTRPRSERLSTSWRPRARAAASCSAGEPAAPAAPAALAGFMLAPVRFNPSIRAMVVLLTGDVGGDGEHLVADGEGLGAGGVGALGDDHVGELLRHIDIGAF